VTWRVAGATALAAVLTLGACGTTYIDSSVSVPDTSPGATTTTLAPVDPDTPLASLLADIETLMFDLDQRVIDDNRALETLARIDELWTVAERQIRAANPDDVYNFGQAIDLARSGVQRRRPADASKGYKIFAEVSAAYLARR
jgi:hypothetical protein